MTPQEELKAIRESGNKKGLSPAEELRQIRSLSNVTSLGIPRARSFEEVNKSSSQEDEGFEYETGAKGGLRAKLSFMETAEEKELLA